MRGTTRSTPVFGSLLEAEEDKDDEEDETNGEDESAGGGIIAL